MAKKKWVTWITVLVVILLAYFIINRPAPETDSEIAKCIGEKATLYIQLGCHACETQEKMFGENYQYINSVDCFFEKEKCLNYIRVTPTWEIGGELIEGTQSISKLQELTGC